MGVTNCNSRRVACYGITGSAGKRGEHSCLDHQTLSRFKNGFVHCSCTPGSFTSGRVQLCADAVGIPTESREQMWRFGSVTR